MDSNSSFNSPPAHEPTRDMTESQRALEVRKFFAPYDDALNTPFEKILNASLNNDGALDAYAETAVWRLKASHAMVSLVDRGTQYFLAGAIRTVDDDLGADTTSEWFGCSTVPSPGGLCENTLSLTHSEEEYPCFIVDDLSKDERFCYLPVVDGSIARYTFYAGTPITTKNGINIGSFFIFDTKPRNGLNYHERKFLHQQAANVMRHLQTKREAAESRRATTMSLGIAKFLGKTAHEVGLEDDSDSVTVDATQESSPFEEKGEPMKQAARRSSSQPVKEKILDKIRLTLDHAADVLREALELTGGGGGVVFLDPAAGDSEAEGNVLKPEVGTEVKDMWKSNRPSGQPLANEHKLVSPISSEDRFDRKLFRQSTRSSADKHKAAKVMAMSCTKSAILEGRNTLDTKTLQSFIDAYPKGNLWYNDDEGYFASIEQASDLADGSLSPTGRRRSTAPVDVSRQKREGAMLSRIFRRARQIIFMPLWDAGGDRWYSGCFVWSHCAIPVYEVASELSYVSVFTNTVMVEINRLDAITSNKMKSDFISSISHEFRSPLHGIMASTEFLRDSELDASQVDLISTIQMCSETLLDTINHVLDYSKINSFENVDGQKGPISNDLYQVTNLALLCEDIITGMYAAEEFRLSKANMEGFAVSHGISMQSSNTKQGVPRLPVEIILDIECRDWDYKIQAGALRRIVMNILGNAQKYTDSGYIAVQLRMKDDPSKESGPHSPGILSLHIRDSGRGISSQYMERKLYQPFAQEDPFAPGVGLGLSIVWSIVNQLGGKISIRSELGKGTDVEVSIPIEREHAPAAYRGVESKLSLDARKCITTLRERATGRSIWLSQSSSSGSQYKDISWSCIEKYCCDWFGFELKRSELSSADLIITDEEDASTYYDGDRVLIINSKFIRSGKNIRRLGRRALGEICSPLGPFKLARVILALMDEDTTKPPNDEPPGENVSDVATQTPLGSPEERLIMNGIIMTDYGFTPQSTSSNTPAGENVAPASEDRTGSRTVTKDHAAPITDGLTQLILRHPVARASAEWKEKQVAPLSMSGSSKPPALITPMGPSRSVTPDQTNSLHILAVDDNAVNLKLLHRFLLKRKADTIVTATNGLEAVSAVKAAGRNDTFDVVFMDISMPELDGFGATRLIRAYEEEPYTLDSAQDMFGVIPRNKRAYIVAITGLASRRDRDEADKSGFDDYLTKPVSFARIGKLLEALSNEKDNIPDRNT